MPQFLTISPTDVEGQRQFAWNQFLSGGYIALGWYHQDFTEWNWDQIEAHIRAQGFANTSQAVDAHRKLMALEIGDFVAVTNVNHGIFGIGRVRSDYLFRKGMHNTGHADPNEFYSHYREVDWLLTDYRRKGDLLLPGELEWAPYGTVGALYEEVPAWVSRALGQNAADPEYTTTITDTAFDDAFTVFKAWALRDDSGIPFTGFDHPMVSPWESYKKEVFKDARAELVTAFWKPADIGTGVIHAQVNKALRPRVIHMGHEMDNNLLDWRLKDDFSNRSDKGPLEEILFELYKSKRSDQVCFEAFMKLGLAYQLIAYLFFLKDRERYLPISQEGFDQAFAKMGVVGFKTSGGLSWENYTTFLDLNRQLQRHLGRQLGHPVDLLDAHSFAWCIGYTFPIWDEELEEEGEGDGEAEGTDSFDANSLMPEDVDVKDFHDELAFPEGKESWILHRKSERNAEVVRIAKERFKMMDPLMRCQVCSFSFAERYGAHGIGYIEAHHALPVSEMPDNHMTKPEDLIMVCSNCHVMLHRKRPWLSHDSLKNLMQLDM